MHNRFSGTENPTLMSVSFPVSASYFERWRLQLVTALFGGLLLLLIADYFVFAVIFPGND